MFITLTNILLLGCLHLSPDDATGILDFQFIKKINLQSFDVMV